MRNFKKRFLVKCQKCGYEWLSFTEHPKRCSFCNNPNPEKPRARIPVRERYTPEDLAVSNPEVNANERTSS
jgi:ribosomal protein L37E